MALTGPDMGPSRLRPLKPLAFVIFQLLVLGWAYAGHVRRDLSRLYRLTYLAALCGVVVFDVWYFLDFAYPAGFRF